MSDPLGPLPSGDIVHLIFGLLSRAQQRFGAARFEMGAVLSTIHEHGLWRGRATSFAAFLEDARINQSAAYQYMRVAKTFFFGLGLGAEELNEVATVPMSLLDIAAKVTTADNVHDVMLILTTLNERDAKVQLETILANIPLDERPPDPKRVSPRVARLYREFRGLPDDQRVEFLQQLQRQSTPAPTETTELVSSA